jgi:hypothetical protein
MKPLLVAASVLLASCVHAPALPSGPDAELIHVRLLPGFGGGRSYDLRVASDGRARLDWNVGPYPQPNRQRRDFTVSPAVFLAFRDALQPYRPAVDRLLSDDNPDCDFQFTDQPNILVAWEGRGPTASLLYDYGCNGKRNRALVEVLTSAPKAVVPGDLAKLPIW